MGEEVLGESKKEAIERFSSTYNFLIFVSKKDTSYNIIFFEYDIILF